MKITTKHVSNRPVTFVTQAFSRPLPLSALLRNLANVNLWVFQLPVCFCAFYWKTSRNKWSFEKVHAFTLKSFPVEMRVPFTSFVQGYTLVPGFHGDIWSEKEHCVKCNLSFTFPWKIPKVFSKCKTPSTSNVENWLK